MESTEILALLAEGESLTTEQTRSAVLAIMEGQCSDAQIASFLTALRLRGETVDELVGTAGVMREKTTPFDTTVGGLLDTCGTGGDCARTFNISTAVALIASACGVPVAKHGNRSVSSSSGSADVLAALGVRIDVPPQAAVDCLEKIGIAFLFAPHWHPAMKNVMAARRELRFRTIFNLVGPLCNPARPAFQLVGVGRPDWADKLADALLRLGVESAAVVTGEDGLDEVTLAGKTRAVRVKEGRKELETWSPESFGLTGSSAEDWRVGSAEESAERIRSVLNGDKGPSRDIVLANAAAALLVANKCKDLRGGVTLASEAIDSGKAARRLEELIEATNKS